MISDAFVVFTCRSSLTYPFYLWGQDSGIPVWIPIVRERPRDNSRPIKTTAAIPGYIFFPKARLSPQLAFPARFNAKPLFSSEGRRLTCRESELRLMQSLLNDDFCLKSSAPAEVESPVLRPGDGLIIVKEHPFLGGAVGVVERLKAEDIIRVRLNKVPMPFNLHRKFIRPYSKTQ